MKKTMIYELNHWGDNMVYYDNPWSYRRLTWKRFLDGQEVVLNENVKVKSIENVMIMIDIRPVNFSSELNGESRKSETRPIVPLTVRWAKIYKHYPSHESSDHYVVGTVGEHVVSYPYFFYDKIRAEHYGEHGTGFVWKSIKEMDANRFFVFDVEINSLFDINDIYNISGKIQYPYYLDDGLTQERIWEAELFSGTGTKIYIDYIPLGQITQPTNVRVEPVSPARGVAVFWHAPEFEKDTWGAEIGSYNIFRKLEDGEEREFELAGTVGADTLTFFDTGVVEGEYYRYAVQAATETIPPSEEDLSEYDSDLSEPSDLTFIQYAPSAPEIANVGSTIYNPHPRILATISVDGNEFVRLTAQAQGYRISRSVELESNDRVLLARAERLRENSTETVRIVNANEQNEAMSDPFIFSYVKPVFSEPIIANETEIKAIHINELRGMVENVCDYYDIARPVWNEQIVEDETPVYRWITHVRELQTEIKRIADYVNAWDSESTANRIALPEFETPEYPTASAMNQLRACIALL